MTDWILAIETVATAGSVAVLKGAEVREFRDLPSELRSAKTLAKVVRDVWSNQGRPAVGLVAVACGPGSFTGLRVGITTSKALAFAWQAKLVGVGTLDVVAAQAPTVGNEASTLQVVLDAQRKEVFAGAFRQQTGVWKRAAEDVVLSMNEWLRKLTPGTLVSGPALDKVREPFPLGVVTAPAAQWHPRAETVGKLAWQMHQAVSQDELWTLTPRYLRPSYAEERRADRESI